MKYVLVIFLLSGGYQGGAHIQEIPFADGPLCQAAAEEINRYDAKVKSLPPIQRPYGQREAFCFQSAKEPVN